MLKQRKRHQLPSAVVQCFPHTAGLGLVLETWSLNRTLLCLLSVFLKYFLTSKSVGSAVLLVGLCDSGKTLLFSRVS